MGWDVHGGVLAADGEAASEHRAWSLMSRLPGEKCRECRRGNRVAVVRGGNGMAAGAGPWEGRARAWALSAARPGGCGGRDGRALSTRDPPRPTLRLLRGWPACVTGGRASAASLGPGAGGAALGGRDTRRRAGRDSGREGPVWKPEPGLQFTAAMCSVDLGMSKLWISVQRGDWKPSPAP